MNSRPNPAFLLTGKFLSKCKNSCLLLLLISLSASPFSTLQAAILQVHQHTKIYTGQLRPIPIKLLDFFGRVQKDIISIKWITAAEMNVNHFILEKSSDGINFTFINKQTGKGVNANADVYIAEDFKPVAGINYYRLKIVCNDRSVFYSKTAIVKYKRLQHSFDHKK